MILDFKILFSWCLFVVLFQFSPNQAQAQFVSGPVSSGAGGAGRASVDPLEGAFLNPASLSQLNHYYLGAYYVDSPGITKNRHRDLSFVIADSTPDKLWPMAVAYTKRRISDPGSGFIDQKDYYLALSDFVFSRLSVGLGFHRLTSTVGGSDFNQHNLHLGFLFTPTADLGLALVGYDLLLPGSDVPSQVKLKRTVALGMTYVLMDFVRFRTDWAMALRENPENDSKLMLGVESVFHEFFTLRVGAQWDDVSKQTFLTTGFSFTGPRFGLNYALQKEIQPEGGGHRHLIDLNMAL